MCCTDSLDGSSNEKELRQYEKWTAEEEHIFFLKLSTVSSLSLLDGFSAIAHHLPDKKRDQVNMYWLSMYLQAASLFKAEQRLEPLLKVCCALTAMHTLQVKWYFYRLKGQFQKHNPSRDVEDLSQKELFQAMSFMWSEVSCTLCCVCASVY